MVSEQKLHRREFLGRMGVAATLSAANLHGMTFDERPATRRPMNWDRVQSDFTFEPGLAYLNTASMGGVPFEAQERATQVLKELEKNPTARGYGDLEKAMDDVRQTRSIREEASAGITARDGMARLSIALRFRCDRRARRRLWTPSRRDLHRRRG